MSKTIRVTASIEEAEQTVTVTAGPGSAGQLLVSLGTTSRVELANVSTACPVQFKVGEAAWVDLPFQAAKGLEINAASVSVRLRRAMWEGGAAAVRVSTEGALTIPAALTVAGMPVVQVPPTIDSAPLLSGGGAVGQAITLTPGAATGTPAPTSTFSWRDAGGNELSTSASAFQPVAAGQITVVQTASNGVGQPATRMSNSVTVVDAPAYPVLPSRFIRAIGDSRTAQATNDPENRARTINTRGFIAWFNAAMDYRMEIVANDGINTETIDGMTNRLDGPGIAGVGAGVAAGTFPTYKGHILTNSPGGSVPISTVLGGGTNDGTEALTTWGPKCDRLLMRLIDNVGADGQPRNNGVVLLHNSTPNSNIGSNATQTMGRRDYYRAWPQASTYMTDVQKAYYGQRVIKAETYNALALAPDSPTMNPIYASAAGADTRHPNALGSRAHGEALAAAALPVAIANNFPKRNQLPLTDADSLFTGALFAGSTAITATNSEAAGAGGSNMDGQGGACFTGVLPTGWALARSSAVRAFLNAVNPLADGSRLNVVSTKTTVTDDTGSYPAMNFRITSPNGVFLGSTFTVEFSNNQSVSNWSALNNGQSLTTGDEARALMRMIVAANPKGLAGMSCQMNLYSNSSIATNGGEVSTHSGANQGADSDLSLMARFDRVLMTPAQPMLEAVISDAGARTAQRRMILTFLPGTPIDVDITISQFGVVKNR